MLSELREIMKDTEEFLDHCDGSETSIRFNELFVSRTIIIGGNEFCMVVNALKDEPYEDRTASVSDGNHE